MDRTVKAKSYNPEMHQEAVNYFKKVNLFDKAKEIGHALPKILPKIPEKKSKELKAVDLQKLENERLLGDMQKNPDAYNPVLKKAGLAENDNNRLLLARFYLTTSCTGDFDKQLTPDENDKRGNTFIALVSTLKNINLDKIEDEKKPEMLMEMINKVVDACQTPTSRGKTAEYLIGTMLPDLVERKIIQNPEDLGNVLDAASYVKNIPGTGLNLPHLLLRGSGVPPSEMTNALKTLKDGGAFKAGPRVGYIKYLEQNPEKLSEELQKFAGKGVASS